MIAESLSRQLSKICSEVFLQISLPTIAALAMFGSDARAATKDPFEFPPDAPVAVEATGAPVMGQKRYDPRADLSLQLHYSPTDTLGHLVGASIGYTKKIGEFSSWEIADVSVLTSVPSLLSERIDETTIRSYRPERPKAMALSHWVWTPLYGKVAMGQQHLTNVDVSLLAGGGGVYFADGVVFSTSFGVKGRFALSPKEALRLELKRVDTWPARDYFGSFIFLSTGWTKSF